MSSMEFYAHGKLMLTSEYFVLNGAQSLAFPLRLGQKMIVSSFGSNNRKLFWKAYTSERKLWLDITFDKKTFTTEQSGKETETLAKLLNEARALNPQFLASDEDILVETYLEFPNAWGFGSSSTLLYCLSHFAEVDWFPLLQKTIGGSGYDVACAGAKSEILYQLVGGKPVVKETFFNPAFKHNLYFVYLGKKQLSSTGISHYEKTAKNAEKTASELSKITEKILQCDTLAEFEMLIDEHENLISAELQFPRVQQELFADYWGKVKSLGAWGGDFALFTNSRSETDLRNYLRAKNLEVVFRFDELVLH